MDSSLGRDFLTWDCFSFYLSEDIHVVRYKFINPIYESICNGNKFLNPSYEVRKASKNRIILRQWVNFTWPLPLPLIMTFWFMTIWKFLHKYIKIERFDQKKYIKIWKFFFFIGKPKKKSRCGVRKPAMLTILLRERT